MKRFNHIQPIVLDRLSKELSPIYTYHCVAHTLDVIKSSAEICDLEQISLQEKELVLTAALLHDTGFLVSYIDHELIGSLMWEDFLKDRQYSDDEIQLIKGMILSTKIPQSPKNLLSKILCDADLDYLGRNDFYDIGKTLLNEWSALGIVRDQEHWQNIQLNFLKAHNYFTISNQNRREHTKQKHIKALEMDQR
ncbi:MAG: HD domain-containing protein [Saprospiraceae bacterium]|nr:HD domain-containing protein [Saprospiraceae bacterium]